MSDQIVHIDPAPIPPAHAQVAIARINAHATDHNDRAQLIAMLGLEETP